MTTPMYPMELRRDDDRLRVAKPVTPCKNCGRPLLSDISGKPICPRIDCGPRLPRESSR